MADLFQPDPTRWFSPRSDLLQCSEENHTNDDDDDDEGAILFSCTAASADAGEDGTSTTSTTPRRLFFRCRDVSIGVLHRGEPAAAPDTSGAADPFFFDANYDLYGKTGFQIWPGSRLLAEALTLCGEQQPQQQPPHAQQPPPPPPPLLLCSMREKVRNGARVLELGSGVGLAGLALAAAGARVLLTDLPTLVRNAIQPNIARNAISASGGGGASAAAFVGERSSSSSSSAWMKVAAVPVGRGWAGAAVLDLMKPLADPLNDSSAIAVSEIDLVVSCDVLSFRKLLESTLNVVDAIFAASPRVEFLFTYQRRVKSEVFTSLEEVLHAMERRGYSTPECLAWRKVCVGKNDEDGSDDVNDLFLFRTTPKSQ